MRTLLPPPAFLSHADPHVHLCERAQSPVLMISVTTDGADRLRHGRHRLTEPSGTIRILIWVAFIPNLVPFSSVRATSTHFKPLGA